MKGRTCRNCGGTFSAENPRKVFCSDRCSGAKRVRAKRERDKPDAIGMPYEASAWEAARDTLPEDRILVVGAWFGAHLSPEFRRHIAEQER